jgi:type I restriction enzyme S subunit
MDWSQFLPHFETLADTPDAVLKLRALVLQLAIRGGLAPQDPEDEKLRQWKDFAARFTAPAEHGDEPPFRIPKSWCWVRLNDVADYRAADKVEASEIKDADRVLDLEEIEKDTSRILRFTQFKEKQSSSTKAKFLPGDVLYGKLRPYLNKVVVAPKRGFCTTELVPIRSRGIVEPAYLCVYLRSADFIAYTNSKSYGMKMPRLCTDDSEAAWVAIPPPAEQHRIVAKLEE